MGLEHNLRAASTQIVESQQVLTVIVQVALQRLLFGIESNIESKSLCELFDVRGSCLIIKRTVHWLDMV